MERKRILIVLPKEVRKNQITFNSFVDNQFEPEKEKKKISDELKKADVDIFWSETPSISGIADLFKKNTPDIVIFYTHGLPGDILLMDNRKCSTEKLCLCFDDAKNNQPNFKPSLVILGACHSTTMAEKLYNRLKIPVIGFKDEMYDAVLTQFIIRVIQSVKESPLEHAYKNGLLSIQQMDNINFSQQYIHAKMFNDPPKMGLFQSLSNMVFPENDLSQISSVKKFSYYERIFGEYYISVTNNLVGEVVVTVTAEDDPIQFFPVRKGSTQKIFIGEDTCFISLYTENDKGYWIHFENKKISTKSSFTVLERHLHAKIHSQFIPGFEQQTKKPL